LIITLVDGAVVTQKIKTHERNGKVIPSGFFNQVDSENISAVLFNNQATILKFNRMGKIAGLRSQKVKMIRDGFLYNSAPNAIHPIHFLKNIDDAYYEESRSDGLIMFHNPKE
jgi:hypothetical protein